MAREPDERERLFRELYAAHFDAVLGFALRRTDRPEDAADVVSDTFLVAWRRLGHVPVGPEARSWLYAVARRTLANQRRGHRRRTDLGGRLRRELAEGREPVAAGLGPRRAAGGDRRRSHRSPDSARPLAGPSRGRRRHRRARCRHRGLPRPGRVGPERPASSSPSAEPVSEPHGYRAVLDAPGWTAASTESDGDYGQVDYADGGSSLAITWYAASSYGSYVEDREHISDPAAPGEPVQVLGAAGQMWAYSVDDHTTIREVADGHWMEIRGTGMSEAAYRTLLGQLRLVDEAGLEASLPPRFVTTDGRDAAIQTILDGIDESMGPARGAFPMGDDPRLHSTESDTYQLGAYVAGQVACAWLDQYVVARSDSNQLVELDAVDAVDAKATSRQWPVLQQMKSEGDYPRAVWDYADEIAAGKRPAGCRSGLGCS